MTAPKLSWIQKGQTSKAYPYEIVATVRGYSVYMYGATRYEMLAHEMSSRRLAQEFCERHRVRESESA